MVIKRVLVVVLLVFLVGCVSYVEDCGPGMLAVDNVCYGGHPIPVHTDCSSIGEGYYQTSTNHCILTPASFENDCSKLTIDAFEKPGVAIQADWLSGQPDLCLFSCSTESDCPSLQTCVPFEDEKVCTPKCSTDTDCLTGVTVCSDMGWCVPSDSKDEICDNGVDDDYDSAVDCNDLDCSEECDGDGLIVFKQMGSIDNVASWLGSMSNTAQNLCDQKLGLSCSGLGVVDQPSNAIFNMAFNQEKITCDTPFSQYSSKIDSLSTSASLKAVIKEKDYQVQCKFACNGEICVDNKQMCGSSGCVSCLVDSDCASGSCNSGLCTSDEVFCSVTDEVIIGTSGSNPSKCELRFRQVVNQYEGYVANKKCLGVVSGVPLLGLQDDLMGYGSLSNNNPWISSDWSTKCPVTFAAQHSGWALFGSTKVPPIFAEAEKCINEGKNKFNLFDTQCVTTAGGSCNVHDDCLSTEACDTENNICVSCVDGDEGKDVSVKATTTGISLGTASSSAGKYKESYDFCLDGKVTEFFCQESTKTGSQHVFLHSNNIFCDEGFKCQLGKCVELTPSDIPEQCDNGQDNDFDGKTTCKDIECATAELCKKTDKVMVKQLDSYANSENWLNGDLTKTGEDICQEVLGMGCADVQYELPGSGTSTLNQEYNGLLVDCQMPFSEFSNRVETALAHEGGFLTTDSAALKNPYYVLCGEVCKNQVDDDGDGLVDCADPDCVGKAGMLPTGKSVTCCLSNDDVDNDGVADQCFDFKPYCNAGFNYCEASGDLNEDFIVDANDLVYLKENFKLVWGLFGVWANEGLDVEGKLIRLNRAIIHINKEVNK